MDVRNSFAAVLVNRYTVAIGVLLALIATLGILLYRFFSAFDKFSLLVSLVVVTMLIPFVLLFGIYLGHWFGRTEVRGFLAGADKMIDKTSSMASSLFATREAAKKASREPTQPAYTANVFQLPPDPAAKYPRIQMMNDSASDEVIDL